jgi:FMN phosphatase YigB (HAD superfamily)
MTRAILFDLYETLVAHYDPNWEPPVRPIAERIGVEETV